MRLTKWMNNEIIQDEIFIKWQIMDLLRTKGMRWISYVRLIEYVFLKYFFNRINLAHLFAAHRYYPMGLVTKVLHKEKSFINDRIDSFVDITQMDQFRGVANRTIILKNPSIQKDSIEKGVLLITFTETFPFFHNDIDCNQLLKYFYVVLEPSWAGYCDPNILFWTKYNLHPVIVQATENKDYCFLLSLRSNLIPVSFGASDWVDFRIFHPIPGITKKYDAIYVTNYSPIKRHHVLFKALKEMNDPNYKVALVFGRNGNAKSDIDHLIQHYNINGNLTIYEWLPQPKLNEMLNMSKVNLLLSIKEGSNRSIFESFFANVPGIVLKNNIGVNKSYINEETGMLIEERELMQVLLHFKNNWHKYNPRKWALNNISPLVTARKLSQYLKKIAEEKGEPWTRDIVPKVNAPEVKYFYPVDERSMPDSQTVLSLFLKSNFKQIGDEHGLRNHLRRICTISR